MKMKMLKRISICLLVFVFVVTMLLPVYATAIVSAPTPYPYGLGSLADDSADAKQMLISEWETWKEKYISKTGGKRVLMDGPTTVSPGMGYGLLFSVYFNEQTLFDELYEYVESCLDSNGLMHWKTQNA